MDAALERIGRGRRIAVSVESLAAVPVLLSMTDLVSTLPYPFSEQAEHLLDSFEPPIKLNDYVLSAFWHSRNRDDPGHVWLRGLLFEVAGKQPESGIQFGSGKH